MDKKENYENAKKRLISIIKKQEAYKLELAKKDKKVTKFIGKCFKRARWGGYSTDYFVVKGLSQMNYFKCYLFSVKKGNNISSFHFDFPVPVSEFSKPTIKEEKIVRVKEHEFKAMVEKFKKQIGKI